MGTNFYLKSNNKKRVKEDFETDCYELVDEPEFGYEIHLCKRSCGWEPLFQIHRQFSTFSELENFVTNNKDTYQIFDEYGREYSFAQFKKEMIEHAGIEPEPLKWVYKNDPLFNPNGKKTLFLEKCDPSEADIYTPFSHEEYQRTERDAMRKYNCGTIFHEDVKYIEDPDYYFDWVDGDFS